MKKGNEIKNEKPKKEKKEKAVKIANNYSMA